MKRLFASVFVALVMLLAGCGGSNTTALEIIVNQDDGSGDMIVSRSLFTDDYMRIDDGTESDNYPMLFDRKNNIMYLINHEERRIIKIAKRSVDVESPIPLNLEEHVSNDPDYEQKTFLNKPVKQYTLLVDNEICFIAYYVDGFLPDAAAAEQQYLSLVAEDNKRVLLQTPADMLSACDLVLNDFYPGSHLKYGYPLAVTNGLSYRRAMQSYDENASVPKSLFVLPEYEILTPEMIPQLNG